MLSGVRELMTSEEAACVCAVHIKVSGVSHSATTSPPRISSNLVWCSLFCLHPRSHPTVPRGGPYGCLPALVWMVHVRVCEEASMMCVTWPKGRDAFVWQLHRRGQCGRRGTPSCRRHTRTSGVHMASLHSRPQSFVMPHHVPTHTTCC